MKKRIIIILCLLAVLTAVIYYYSNTVTFRLLTPEDEVEKVIISNYHKDDTVIVTENIDQILKRIEKIRYYGHESTGTNEMNLDILICDKNGVREHISWNDGTNAVHLYSGELVERATVGFFTALYWLALDIPEQKNDLKIGKNVTVTVSEELDAEAIRNDDTSFALLDEKEFLKLIDYLQENNFRIKPGIYTFNQAWDFDDGDFILPNGERRKVLEFTEKSG